MLEHFRSVSQRKVFNFMRVNGNSKGFISRFIAVNSKMLPPVTFAGLKAADMGL